jgi:hypothetical protein
MNKKRTRGEKIAAGIRVALENTTTPVANPATPATPTTKLPIPQASHDPLGPVGSQPAVGLSPAVLKMIMDPDNGCQVSHPGNPGALTYGEAMTAIDHLAQLGKLAGNPQDNARFADMHKRMLEISTKRYERQYAGYGNSGQKQQPTLRDQPMNQALIAQMAQNLVRSMLSQQGLNGPAIMAIARSLIAEAQKVPQTQNQSAASPAT